MILRVNQIQFPKSVPNFSQLHVKLLRRLTPLREHEVERSPQRCFGSRLCSIFTPLRNTAPIFLKEHRPFLFEVITHNFH